MLKKLILIEGKNEFQTDDLEDIVKVLIDKDYYNLDKESKLEKIRIKALANTLGDNDINLITKDEITYILSLLTTDKIVLLERKDADVFAKDLNKENFEGNYIVLNRFASKLLDNYIEQ